MTGRISIAQLRTDCLNPAFDPDEPVVVNPAELSALLEAVEAAHAAQTLLGAANPTADTLGRHFSQAKQQLDLALARFDFGNDT